MVTESSVDLCLIPTSCCGSLIPNFSELDITTVYSIRPIRHDHMSRIVVRVSYSIFRWGWEKMM